MRESDEPLYCLRHRAYDYCFETGDDLPEEPAKAKGEHMAIGFYESRGERRARWAADFRDALLAKLRGGNGGELSEVSLTTMNEMLQRRPHEFAAGATSDDLTSLLSDVSTARFLDFSRAANPTFRAVTRRISFRDFREARWASYAFPNLLPTGEGGEVKVGEIVDRSEPIVVETYSRIASLTREAMVADSINALDAIPRDAARSAVARQSALFWNLATSDGGAGPTTGDGESYFSAAHNNVGSTAPLSTTSLGEGMELLRNQRDPQGNEMGLEPAFLVVEPSDEITARQVLESVGLTGRLRLLVEPRASGSFYLFTDPATFAPFVRGTIGDGEPIFVARSAFEAGQDFEGISFKLTLDVGFGSGDWRGAVRVPTS